MHVIIPRNTRASTHTQTHAYTHTQFTHGHAHAHTYTHKQTQTHTHIYKDSGKEEDCINCAIKNVKRCECTDIIDKVNISGDTHLFKPVVINASVHDENFYMYLL